MIRYAITVLCIFTIDFLLLKYFDHGAKIVMIGVVGWIVILGGRWIWRKVRSGGK